MSNTTHAVRAPIIAALAPLGWTLDMLAHAANCSAAVIRKDLHPRGGLTRAFPDRPTGNAVYAATFEAYVTGELPNERAIAVATKFLNIERITCLVEGMERGLAALQDYAFPPEHKPYVMLLKKIFFIRSKQTSFKGLCAWDQYCDDLRSGARPLPLSSDIALAGASDCFRNMAERLDITLIAAHDITYDEDIAQTVTAALARLDVQEQVVIKQLYGLETGQPQTMRAVGRKIQLTHEQVRQIEHRAIYKLRDPSWHTTLRRFVGTVGHAIDEAFRLHLQVLDLRREVVALRADYEEVKAAVAEGRDPRVIINAQNPNLYMRLNDINEFSVHTHNCFMNAGLEYIYQLVEKTEADLLKTKNFGRQSIRNINKTLSNLGLSLGMTLPPSFHVGKFANM